MRKAVPRLRITGAPLVLVFCASVAAPAQPAAITEAGKTRLAAVLPAGKPVRFYSSDLYQYIDGAADVFHAYGLVAMAHQEYKVKDANVTVDVYDMGDPLKAFGIYAAERAPDYHFIEVGAEGYVSGEILNFLQGNYYVKLSAFSEKTKTAALLESVARSISAKIGPDRTMPRAVAWLPTRGLVARSEKYVVKEPLGHEFLAPAATALYRLDGKETTLLVSLAAGANDAAARVARLKEHFTSSGKVAALTGMPAEVWRGANQSEGEMIFFARGPYAVVVIGTPAQPEAFLKELFRCMN